MSPVPINEKVVFRNPNFRVHKSLLRFVVPLSKFAKLPSNVGKELVAGVIIVHPDTFSHLGHSAQILLLQRSQDGVWELPSGRAIFGTDQTLLEGVARITRESTGLRVTDIVKSVTGVECTLLPSGLQQDEEATQKTTKPYFFFVKADPAGIREDISGQLGAGYASWIWATREDLDGSKPSALCISEEMLTVVNEALDFIDAALVTP